MKIVCDTNVLVSGILFGGHARTILTAISRGRIDAFTTPALLNELRDVLTRRKFRLNTEQIDAIMELLRESLTCASPLQSVSGVVEDPDDDRVLEAAIASGSRLIVSGDNHLLQLAKWRSIRILSPADFVSTCLAP